MGIFGDGTEDSDTQIIESVTEIQEVALLEPGIDGEDVTLESTGEDSFAITIPEFTFIGHGTPG